MIGLRRRKQFQLHLQARSPRERDRWVRTLTDQVQLPMWTDRASILGLLSMSSRYCQPPVCAEWLSVIAAVWCTAGIGANPSAAATDTTSGGGGTHSHYMASKGQRRREPAEVGCRAVTRRLSQRLAAVDPEAGVRRHG